jgi:hypothetical protein
MTAQDVVVCINKVERRLGTLADQILEIRAQAQHALDRLNLLRREMELLRGAMHSSDDTVHDCPAVAGVESSRPRSEGRG